MLNPKVILYHDDKPSDLVFPCIMHVGEVNILYVYLRFLQYLKRQKEKRIIKIKLKIYKQRREKMRGQWYGSGRN